MGQPTTDPIQERIIADVVETLEEISTRDATTSYWSDVRHVHRFNAGFPRIEATPAIVVFVEGNSTSDSLESSGHAVNEEELEIALHGYIENAADPSTGLQRLVRDIRTALMLDPKRNGLAEHTFVNQATYHHAPDVNEPWAHLVLQIRIAYRTDATDLESVIS